MLLRSCLFLFFFFNDTATTEIYTLSLHDALPILKRIFSFSSGTLNRLGSRGAVMGGSARDGAARLLDLRAGRGRHRHALHAELALYVPHAEQLEDRKSVV